MVICGLAKVRRCLAACGCAAAAAVSGCTAAAPAGQPAWAGGLGASVAVAAPAPAAAGQGSPAAAVTGMIRALNAGNSAQACGYFLPAAQPQCAQALRAAPAGSLPTVKGLAIGYVASDGSRALVGTTGTYCTPGGGPEPTCFTNRDPAAIFSSGRSFAALWARTVQAENLRPAYSLAPCVKSGGRWYDDALPGSGGI